MMNPGKYKRQYFMPPEGYNRWLDREYIKEPPIWCSVDLRDGNQSLVTPMNVEQKLRFFQILVDAGFKEIEVGFPAASDTEFRFIRQLIEQEMIPEDVTIQVLTQAREHIIRRTFEAIDGCRDAIVHLYSPISYVQRKAVFQMTKQEILELALEGAIMLRELSEGREECCRFEYSPESFTGTEPEYALEVCNAVLSAWQPTPERKAIINLPGTVELSLPHIYASQIEYMSRNLDYRENVILSLHPHNDRGCAVADAELGILAGADRVEGTLFGNGERAGNVDIVTLAMNLYAHGVDPKLRFEQMDELREEVEHLTGMNIDERRPYSGALVFAAFSGSHQDAIAKSLKYWEQETPANSAFWSVPYLIIDPADIGRSADHEVIRITSQSGKGGVGYILEQMYGLRLPKRMREEMSWLAKSSSDSQHTELSPEEVFELFVRQYENVTQPYNITNVHFRQHNGIIAEVTIWGGTGKRVVLASGNGRLNAVSNALKKYCRVDYDLDSYEEHALEKSASSRAIAYVGIRAKRNGKLYWGAGVHEDLVHASIDALLAAVNRLVIDLEPGNR